MSKKIPSDEEILKELKAKIAVLSLPVMVARNGEPDIAKLVEERRQWYRDQPKRDAADAQRKKEVEKAEKQYLLELKKLGKPVIKQSELIAQYPTVEVLRQGTLTQRELQRYAEILQALGTASELHKEGKAIEQQYFAPGRKKTGELIAKVYELYLFVQSSALRDEIYEQMAAILKQSYSVTVHRDTPNATLLLKMIFPDMQSKTAHQYGRGLEFARAYEVAPKDYVEFITEYGGYEKIRAAYAQVLAADAGKLLPLQKRAAASATRTFVNTREPIVRMQLTAEQGHELRRYQSLSGYSYLIARVDMHNYLEIIAAIPPGDGWEDNLLRHIEKSAKHLPDWQAAYERLYGLEVKSAIAKTAEKATKAEKLAKHRAKREAGQRKRDESFKRKAERDRKKAEKTEAKK